MAVGSLRLRDLKLILQLGQSRACGDAGDAKGYNGPATHRASFAPSSGQPKTGACSSGPSSKTFHEAAMRKMNPRIARAKKIAQLRPPASDFIPAKMDGLRGSVDSALSVSKSGRGK